LATFLSAIIHPVAWVEPQLVRVRTKVLFAVGNPAIISNQGLSRLKGIMKV